MFLKNVSVAAKQVFALYLIAAAGFIADKLKIYTENTARATNDLMFYIVTPAVIINSFLSEDFSPSSAKGFFTAVGCSFLAHFLGIILTLPLFNKKGEDAPVYKFASIYGNVGYMALPLAEAVLGKEGVFYCSGAVIAFNTLAFTHGVRLMNKGENSKFNIKSLILNPGVISVLAGLPFFIFSISPPEIITKPISLISNLNTPLAMLIFGTYISNTDLKNIFKDPYQYLVMAVRLIAVPLITLLFCKALKFPQILLTACIISAASPSANNTVMFSAKYGKDAGLASKIVATDNLASIVTLPLLIALTL